MTAPTSPQSIWQSKQEERDRLIAAAEDFLGVFDEKQDGEVLNTR